MDDALDCPLCRVIRAGGGAVEFEDEHFVVLRPLEARAPVHLLIVPRRHAESLHEFVIDNTDVGGMLRVAVAAAARAGVRESGFRLVMNSGPATDQTVVHPHLHVIGGEQLEPHP